MTASDSPTAAPLAPGREGAVSGPALRQAMGRFLTGVAVVTTEWSGQPHGMTVNSLTSVSLDPPLILVSLMPEARTTRAVDAAGRFAVSILSERQREIALRFARRAEDHFEGLPLEYGQHDVPVVPDALAHLECTVAQRISAGDHIIMLGSVGRTCQRDGAPLGFHSGRFGEFAAHGNTQAPWFF